MFRTLSKLSRTAIVRFFGGSGAVRVVSRDICYLQIRYELTTPGPVSSVRALQVADEVIDKKIGSTTF
jgi:hypothetical protein